MLKAALLLSLLTQSASAAEDCQALLDEPRATVRRCLGVSVVTLRGAPVERAEAMGQLLRGPLSPEVVNYFAHKVTESAAENAGLAGRLAGLAYNQLVRLFHRATPAALTEEIDAMAHGMGIDPIVLRRGLSLPDTAALLQGLGSHPWLEFLPAVGCTSAAAETEEGFTWGRNLDFAGVGTFDRHPMLLTIEPPAGSSELRHVVLGADGLLYGGITGVNEAGIAFAVHQNFSRDVGVSGVPMILIGEMVLRGARDLAQAEEILRRYRPASQWTFVVADLHNREMMAVESSQRNFLVRRKEGAFFAQTNHAMHQASRDFENGDAAVIGNSVHRMKKAFELLEAERAPSPASAAKVLAYQESQDGQFSSYHDVLKAETIQSVVFESAGGALRVYLSIDEAPSSGGRYARFPFGSDFRPGTPAEVDLVRTPAAKRLRQREIALAYHTYFELRRPGEAATILADHQTLDAALFRALAAYREGRYEETLSVAESAQRNPRWVAEPAYLFESFDALRIGAWLRLGRRDPARELAARLLEKDRERGLAKGFTRRLARHVARGEDPPGWMLNFAFNFFSGDLGGRKDRFEQR